MLTFIQRHITSSTVLDGMSKMISFN